MELSGKVAIITGGSSGIGRATALALARAGARIVIGNRNTEKGEEAVKAIKDAGGQAVFRKTDVAHADQLKRLVAVARDTFGGLDLAFNNAGIEGELAPLHELDPQTAAKVFEININGVFYALKYEIEAMLESGGGVIVNSSSIFGLKAVPGFSPYVASKPAIAGLTRAAALDYARHNIRVNAVAPGPIETRMLMDASGGNPDAFASYVPMGRIGQPEEVANAVLWLLSDDARYVNGHIMSVDGAWCAS